MEKETEFLEAVAEYLRGAIVRGTASDDQSEMLLREIEAGLEG